MISNASPNFVAYLLLWLIMAYFKSLRNIDLFFFTVDVQWLYIPVLFLTKYFNIRI